MSKQRGIIIVAGPNGAGKTTFAREYLVKEAHCPDFVNVDLIAAGLSPFDPDRAAIQREAVGSSMSHRVNSPSREAQDTLRALRRAARKALELGIKTGTPVYVIRNNEIVDLTKQQLATRKSRSSSKRG